MGPQLKVVERTRTATMLCAASGNPDPEITWFKDFLPVDPSASNGRIKQLRSGKGRGWREQIEAAEGPEGEERAQRCCGLGNLGVLGFLHQEWLDFFHFEPSWSSLLPRWHEGNDNRGDKFPGSWFS